MNSSKNFIRGIMNKDLDDRLLPDGIYRNAININVSSSDDKNAGTVQNHLGNTEKMSIDGLLNAEGFTLQGDNVFPIGSFTDTKNNAIYWFLTSTNYDMIVRYHESDTGTVTGKLVLVETISTGIMNFDRQYLITGVNLVENLLFFTDGLNPPRRIDVTRVYRDASISEDTVNVIVKPPLNSPVIELIDDTTDEANNLEDKFIRFAYRYRYVNNEVSALSPFSETAFEAKEFSFDYATGRNISMQNKANSVNITVELGSDEVEFVDIVMKDTRNLNAMVVTSIDKRNIDPAATTYQYKFKNNKIYTVLPDSQVNRLFDNVPLKAKAQDLIGSRIIYGNYKQFYDIKKASGEDIIMDFELNTTENSIVPGTPTPTFKSGRDYEAGIAYLDDFGRMTTVLESKVHVDNINIPITNASKKNDLKLKIYNNAPEFASKYRVFLKQNRGRYYNIIPISVVNDGLFVYLQIARYDIDKVKEGDYIYIKSTPSGVKEDSDKYKVIEAAVKPKDFLGDKVGQIQDEGFYIKIKVPNPNYFSEDSIYTLKQTNNGKNSKGNKNGLDSYGANFFGNRYNWTGVEKPIHYGSGDNTSLSAVFRSSDYTFDTDRRLVIEITGSNTFSWRDYNAQWYYGENVTMNVDSLPPLLFNGANGNYLIANIGGNNITFGIISWDTSSPYTIGDSFRLNYRGGKYGIFGTPVQQSFDQNEYWSGPYTAFPDLGGTINNNPGDLAITPGTVIEIQVTDTFEQENQRFISSGSYANIEEWFFEERIYNKYKQYLPDGKSDGAKAVFFRRGIYTQYNPPGGGGGTQTIIEDVNDPRGYVMMCIKGYATSTSKNDQKEIKVNFSIRVPDNYTILETEGDPIADNVYYELPGTYPIIANRRHGKLLASDQDQGTFTPAVITIEDFNAVSFGNGMESSIIEDDWNGPMLLSSPRASTSIEDYKQVDANNFLTYSGVFDITSGVNSLNEFNLSLANFRQLHKEFGSIQKLYARNADLVVFQEDKVSRVLYSKNLISDSSGGGVITTNTDVLGTQLPYDAEYGISNNPESFAKWGTDVYFTDQKRGSVLKLTDGVGIEEVSSLGMKAWFRDLFDDYPDTQKIGAFDPNEFVYVLSNNETEVVKCMASVSLDEIDLSGDALTNVFLFKLFANRNWTISKINTGSGTDWLTLNQTSGNGDAAVGGTLTSNIGGATERTMTLRVNACGSNIDIILRQSNRARKDVVVVTYGDKQNDGAKLIAPKYNYGSGDVGFGQIPLYNGSEYIFNPKSGIVGADGIPGVSSTVSIIAGAGFGTATAPLKAFNPNLGNKMYHLDTNTEYDPTQGATLIAAATQVPSYSLVGGEYKGNFTYNATNKFLYMITDYTNTINPGASVSSIPVPTNGLPEAININNANVLGNYSVSITSTSTNIRMTVENAAGVVIADTGFLNAPSAVSLSIKKSTIGGHVIKVYNTITAGSPTYNISVGAMGLTSASISSAGFATSALACASSGSTQTIYHDGAGASPVQGDNIYVDAIGEGIFVGGLQYYKTGTNAISINDQGVVTDLVSCICGESNVPVVNQIDVNLVQGTEVSFVISATNNPFSYAAAGSCREFTLYGGSGSAVFSGQDCTTGVTKSIFVSINQTITQCFWTDSVYALISSDGSYFTDNGGCTTTAIPPGLDFDSTNGIISGTPTQQGQYTFTVTATNCVGTSSPASFKMIVGPETPPTTAFNIDVTNTQTSSSSACSLVTPSYSVLYHNGLLAYPVIRDVIFRDELATILFNGNGLWYSTTLGIAVKIDVDGTVLDTFQCGVGSITPTPPTWTSIGALANSNESALTACGATPTGAFWYSGTLGANPGKLSIDFEGTAYAPAGWYKSGTDSYYWDGSQWGSVTPCP
jgi:hypothetical protein